MNNILGVLNEFSSTNTLVFDISEFQLFSFMLLQKQSARKQQVSLKKTLVNKISNGGNFFFF